MNVKEWIEEIKQNAPSDTDIVLVGTKCDNKQRQVSTKEGKVKFVKS